MRIPRVIRNRRVAIKRCEKPMAVIQINGEENDCAGAADVSVCECVCLGITVPERDVAGLCLLLPPRRLYLSQGPVCHALSSGAHRAQVTHSAACPLLHLCPARRFNFCKWRPISEVKLCSAPRFS